MPDFGRDLNPILLTDKQDPLRLPNPATPVAPNRAPINVSGNGDGGGDPIFGKGPIISPMLPTVSAQELYDNRRYGMYNANIVDIEDQKANAQGYWDKAANGVLKGLNLAATTVVGGFGMLYGTGKWAFGGKFSDIWNNKVMQDIDKWNNEVDQNVLPNYYTNVEKNAEWYSTDNWLKANFLYDKLIKNSGFAVGAMVSGNIANAGLLRLGNVLGKGAAGLAGAAESAQAFKMFTPLLRNTARVFSAGKNIEAAAVLEDGISSVADLTAKSSQLAKIHRQKNAISNIADYGRRTAIAAYSSAGEASFEAMQTANQYRDNLIDEYRKTHGGVDPDGQELANINERADNVGKTSFFGNMALLSITEFTQLPYLLGSSYKSSKQAANSLLGKADDVIMKDGKYAAIPATTTKFGKLYDKVKGVGMYVFDPKEAGQEIGQYALQVGTQNYFNKAYRTGNADAWVDGFLYGMIGRDENDQGVGAFVSKEGMESGLLGGITGGLMQARQNYVEKRTTASNTQDFLNRLNGAPTFKQAFRDRLEHANRGIVLQEQEQDAVVQGDKLEGMDLRFDATHNYLAPRIKYGRMDMVMEDIADLRAEGMTEEGLASLKEQGMANVNDTIQSYQQRLTEFETTAKNIDELYKSINLRYSGVKDENGDRKYSPLVIDKMVYAASKIADYDIRIPKLNMPLVEAGIDTSSILTSIIKEFEPNREATEGALDTINELDLHTEIKDGMKSALSDVMELSMRRKLFMDEYDSIKANPEEFDFDPEFEFGDTEELPAIIKQLRAEEGRRKKTVEMAVEIGKEYSLKQPYMRIGNTISMAPKLTVLSQTLGGEYEVKLPNGQITFLNPDQFKDYQLTEANNQSPQLEELLTKAINRVLGKKKWADVPKPTGDNVIEHLNNLNNAPLVNEVMTEFKKTANQFLKELAEKQAKSERMKKYADQIKRTQEEIMKMSGDGPTGEDPVDSTFMDLLWEDMKKHFQKLFTSTTTASVDWARKEGKQLAPHIVRFNEFMNKAKHFKNRDKLRMIIFTQKNEEALGLNGKIGDSNGLAELSFSQEKLDKAAINNTDMGFVGAVFVREGKNGTRYFVDKNGKDIGKVGDKLDAEGLSQVIFSTMPSVNLFREDGERRHRNYQEKEAVQYANAWGVYRKKMFEAPANQYVMFEFGISRGIPERNKDNPEKNFVEGTLISEEDLKNRTVVVVPTKGTVAHEDGNNYKFQLGRPVFVNGDDVVYLNNNKFSEKKAKTIFAVIKKWSDEINQQIESGKAIVVNENYYKFLTNTVYWNDKADAKPSTNRIYLDTETNMLTLFEKNEKGEIEAVKFDFANIGDYETQIVNLLKNGYHNVNNNTLKLGLSEPIPEFYLENGELKMRTWPNYQSMLIANKNPDGTARSIEDVPLFTNLSKPTDAVPFAFKQKYAFAIGMELGVQEVKPSTPEAKFDGTTENDFTINAIGKNIKFTATKDEATGKVTVLIPATDYNNGIVKDVLDNRGLVDTITGLMNKAGVQRSASETEAEFITKSIATLIESKYNVAPVPDTKVQDNTPPPPPPSPTSTNPPTDNPGTQNPPDIDISGLGGEYMRVGVQVGAEPMSEAEMEYFEKWAKKKVPGIPFIYLDNMIKTHDGKEAFGAFVDGVALLAKKGAKGVGFHEIMEGVWKGFLSPAEQQALLTEFRGKKGSFVDRASGQRIDYNEATDLQAKERIMDDFAEFMLGKIPARTIGGKILQFFKAIIELFKSFVANRSLIDQLFQDVYVGKYKNNVFPMERLTGAAAYMEIPGLTQQQVQDFVQDMSSRLFGIIFNEDRSIFEPDSFTGGEIFGAIKTDYRKVLPESRLSDTQYDQLIVQTKNFLRRFGIEFDHDNAVTINDEGSNNRDYAPDPFTINFKKSSPYAVKLLIATLPKAQRSAKDILTGLSPIDRKQSSIGGATLVPFIKTFNTIMEKLSNTRDEQDFIKKLYDLTQENPDYERLFKRLGGDLSTGKINFDVYNYDDWRLWIQFTGVFTKQRPEAMMQYIDGETKYTASANRATAVTQAKRDWTENLKRLATKPDAIITLDASGKNYVVNPASKDFKEANVGSPEKMLKLLNDIGIEFTPEIYSKLKRSQITPFSNAVSGILTGLRSGKKVMNAKTRELDIKGHVKTLAEMFVAVTNPVEEGVFFNNKGRQQQTYTESNVPSLFEYLFNSVENLDELKNKYPQLKDVFANNSVLLKPGGPLFDEDGLRRDGTDVKVQYVLGDNDIREGEGDSISQLTIGKRMSLELNQNMRGGYYIVVPGDSSTEWMINLGNQLDFKLFTDRQEDAQIGEIFKNYLKDEIDLALDGERRKKSRNVGKRAFQLRFFRQLLPESLVTKIEDLIVSDDADKIAKLDKLVEDNTDVIVKSVNDFINDEVEKTKKILIDTQELKMNEDGTYEFIGIENAVKEMFGLSKYYMKEDQLNAFLKFLRTNHVINNTELHKILFGDPYQFETKIKNGKEVLDEIKRIKSFLSPRKISYNSDSFNNFLNDKLNKAGDIKLSENDFGYHVHKDFLKTATLSDVQMASVLGDRFPEYLETNEADAASWMMDGAYREVKLKNGQWPKEADQWHQWQMAYTRNKLAAKGIYTYTNKALEKRDAETIRKPEPQYFLDVIKPIVTGNKFGKDYHDQVLDKFSQMPLYYKAVEGKALENLYVKMFQEKYDYVIMQSGRKEGAEELHKLYDGGSISDKPFNNVINIPWQAYGIQVENSYEKEKLQTLGSQLTKIASIDLFADGESIGNTEERKQIIQDAVVRLDNALRNAIKNGYGNLLKKLSIEDTGDGYTITNPSVVAETLRQEILRRNVSQNGIDSITTNPTTGQFDIPFEASTNYRQIKDILYAIVDKLVVSRKVSGFSAVQVPVTGWEDAKKGRKLAVKDKDGYREITAEQFKNLSDAEKSKVVLTDDTLKFYEDENGKRHCEVMVSSTWIRKKLQGSSRFKTDAELLEYLKSEEGKKILRGIGFRIPTQGLNSVEVFEIAGFIPEFMGRTVVVPSAITTKAGSDFDIDKLNMYLKAVYLSPNGEIKYVQLLETEEATKEFYRNVYNDTIGKKLERITRFSEFRDKLLSISNKLETDAEIASVRDKLTDEELEFYDFHIDLLESINEQAAALDMDTSEYIKEQIERLGKVREDLQAALFNQEARENYVSEMYTKALDNEYFEALEDVLTLPENFERLIKPNSVKELEAISNEIDDIMGTDDSQIKNKLLSPTYLTQQRQNFVAAKLWIGRVAVNITGLALAQKAGVYTRSPLFTMVLPHNTRTVSGQEHVSLGAIFDTDGNYISDTFSQYANGLVDILKSTAILRIMYSDKVVSTILAMNKAGVPMRTAALFINQPIIREYINYLDSKGLSPFSIPNDEYLELIKQKYFNVSSDALQNAVINASNQSLRTNIEDYFLNKKLTEAQIAEQHLILDEFVTYFKLGEANFRLTQATNYDTTSFKSIDDLYRKQLVTDLADETNMLSSASSVLNNSHLGELAKTLDKSSDALGAILKFNLPTFREVIGKVIRPYASSVYVSKDNFSKIAEKVTASFLDYVVQINMASINLKSLVVDQNSVADRVVDAKLKHPEVKMLEFLKVESSDRVGGAKTVRLVANSKEAYDEDMYIGFMREMRSNPDTRDLYYDLVKLSIVQGTYRSHVSIKNIVPLEDYAKIVEPIISALVVDDTVRNFFNEKMFQRNNFRDKNIVPTMSPTFSVNMIKDATGELVEDVLGLDANDEEIYQYNPKSFPEIPDLGVVPSDRKIMLIHPKKFNSQYSVVKVPRQLQIGGKNFKTLIDFITGRTLTAAHISERREVGDTTLDDLYGYKRLETEEGIPYITENGYYIYKQINLLGDGPYAYEYKTVPTPSEMNNGTIPVDEIPDADIIRSLVAQPAAYKQTEIGIVATNELPQQPVQFKNMPEFNSLPGKSETPTMTYAGIGGTDTPANILAQMEEVARELQAKGYTLRSGAAKGADTAFEKGAGTKKEIFPGNVKTGERELIIAKEIHPAWDRMLDAARRNAKAANRSEDDAAAYVANLQARNTNQIFGENLDTPVDFVLAWTPDGITNYKERSVKSGGTGQAIDMASRKGIPVINLANPNWREELEQVLETGKLAAERPIKPSFLPMTSEHIAQIKSGEKTITNRKELFVDGVYSVGKGEKIEIKLIGKARIVNLPTGAVLEMENDPFNKNTNKFAQAEGYKNWQDFAKRAQFSDNFINGKQARYIYSVKYISEGEEGGGITEGAPEVEPTGPTINIFAGTGENADLSNFANRPFNVGGLSYKNVESAFQHAKIVFSDPITQQPSAIQTANWTNLTGAEARNLGRQFTGLDRAEWDRQSPAIMKTLIKASFEQNPQAAQRLIETGNAVLTHTSSYKPDRWTTEFPKILMEVREELKGGVVSVKEEEVGQTEPPTPPSREHTPEEITSLKPNEVFVFGSNTEGKHGSGAAKLAADKFGARYGQAEGPQGQSYAIITKDLAKGERSIPLTQIAQSVDKFMDYAAKNPDKKFYVTKIGAGLAGYSTEEIGKIFMDQNEVPWLHPIPDNVILPKEFDPRDQEPYHIVTEETEPTDLTDVKPPVPAGKTIFDARTSKLTYTVGQTKALQDIQNLIRLDRQGYYLLAGYAGTGKTTIAENIAKFAKGAGRPVAILAPTNKAAKVLNDKLKAAGVTGTAATTIHSAIYGQPKEGEWIAKEKVIKNAVIIIDESSMISRELMEDLILNTKKNNILIFMGDGFQLEPVGEDAGLFKDQVPQIGTNKTELTEVRRQSLDSNILKVATLTRVENQPYVPKESLNDFKVTNSKDEFVRDFRTAIKNDEDVAMIVATNVERIAMNKVARMEKFGPTRTVLEPRETLISVANSNNASNSEIFKALNILEDPQEHKITFTFGDKKQEYSMYITTISNEQGVDHKIFHFPQLDRPSLYHQQILRAIKESNPKLFDDLDNGIDIIYTDKGKQMLSPAITITTYGYSVTAHKSQGSQWSKVFVNHNYNAPGWNAARWYYTAITRASRDVIVLRTANSVNISESEMNNKLDNAVVTATPTNTMTLSNGATFRTDNVNAAMLEDMGYTPDQIGEILKSIC